MIETLWLRSIAGDPIVDCMNRLAACAVENGAEIPSDFRQHKHLSQMYLATKDTVQLPPGIASYREAWPFNHAAFDDLKAFLRSL